MFLFLKGIYSDVETTVKEGQHGNKRTNNFNNMYYISANNTNRKKEKIGGDPLSPIEALG